MSCVVHLICSRGSKALGTFAFAVLALVSMPLHAEVLGAASAVTETSETVSGSLASAGGVDALTESAATAIEAVMTAIGAGDAPQTMEIDRGKGSWYGGRFHGRRTASGEKFDMHDLTAAHKTLPFGTRVRVRDLQTGKEVVVRINDRGPHVRGRIIDLSRAAAVALGVLHAGEAAVALLLH
jgi:rare lipoprotein A